MCENKTFNQIIVQHRWGNVQTTSGDSGDILMIVIKMNIIKSPLRTTSQTHHAKKGWNTNQIIQSVQTNIEMDRQIDRWQTDHIHYTFLPKPHPTNPLSLWTTFELIHLPSIILSSVCQGISPLCVYTQVHHSLRLLILLVSLHLSHTLVCAVQHLQTLQQWVFLCIKCT